MYFTCEYHSELLKASKISKCEFKYEKIAMIIILIKILLTKSTPNLITLIASATSATTWSQSWQIVVSLQLCLILLLPRNILSVRLFVGPSETEKTPKDNIRPIGTNSAIDRSAPVTMVDVTKVEVIMVREFVLTVHSAVSKLGDGL